MTTAPYCRYCKRTLAPPDSQSLVRATRDHFVPQCAGGKKTVWCCYACNQIKGSMLPEAWIAYMAQNPGWWRLPAKPVVPKHWALPGIVSGEPVRELARQIVRAEIG